MAELKTKENNASVTAFLKSVENDKRRADALEVLKIMKKVTKTEPKMWGTSIIGFGSYHYKYESGREGDWFRIGFSPRKQNLVLYMMYGSKKYKELLPNLGKYKSGKACVYINKLEDVDLKVLNELCVDCWKNSSQ